MPTPVNLTLHTVNENDLVDSMIAAMQVEVPEWIPQEGATEVVLMEALALVMGQQIFALNQLPRVVLDGIIAIRGYARNPAVSATGQVTVTLAASTLGTRLLPAGARFRLGIANDATIDMLTVEDVSINPTDGITGVVHVIADTPGVEANGITIGTVAVMVDTFTWVESAVVSATIGGGADEETDSVFYARVAAAFQALSTTLVIDQQFATAALGVAGVGRAKGYGLWDGVGAIGSMGGHIAVAIAAADGTDLSDAIKAQVLAVLTAGAVAGLQVHIINFSHASMNLVVQYSAAIGATVATVTAAIEVVLRAWLNPITWPYTETLTSVNQIILRIGTVPGVDNVTSVTGWTTITDGNTLPLLGTVTITAV